MLNGLAVFMAFGAVMIGGLVTLWRDHFAYEAEQEQGFYVEKK